MASRLILPVLLLGTLASIGIAQEFNFDMPDNSLVYEGRDDLLVVRIIRSSPIDQQATVAMVTYELTNNNNLEWEIPVIFAAGQALRELPLGVIDDNIYDPNRMYIFMLKDQTVGALGAQSTVVVSYIDNDGPPRFDCRADDSCAAGACNSLTGHCDCPQGFGFQDCSLDLNGLDVPSTACSAVTCGIGGVCVVDSLSGAKCACQPGYGGIDCARSDKYDVMCYRNGMCLNVNPPSSYVGSRYIRGKDGAPSCMLQQVTSEAIATDNLPSHWLDGSYICLPNVDATCGNADFSMQAGEISSYSREVHIRMTNEFILHRDILFTGHCLYDSNGVLYFTHTVTPGGMITLNRTDTVETTNIYLVNKDDGQRYTQSVFGVGDEICFALELADSFSSLRLNNVIADNRKATPVTQEILRNGCPVPDLVNVVTKLPYRPSSSKRLIYFCFAAFTFPFSEEVGLRFETTVCPVSDLACTPHSCDNVASYGRKKRDIQTSNTILETKIRVVENRPTNERQTGEEGTTVEECAISKAIIAALSILAVVALILLFATILLVIRSCRSRDKLNE